MEKVIIVNEKKCENEYMQKILEKNKDYKIYYVSTENSDLYLSQFTKVKRFKKYHAVQIKLTRKTIPLFYGFAYIGGR